MESFHTDPKLNFMDRDVPFMEGTSECHDNLLESFSDLNYHVAEFWSASTMVPAFLATVSSTLSGPATIGINSLNEKDRRHDDKNQIGN